MRKRSIGQCTVYHADCIDVLPEVSGPIVLVTDPPYGLAKKWRGGKQEWPLAQRAEQWDQSTMGAALKAAVDRSKQAIVWGGHLYDLPPSRGWLIWDKKVRGFTSGDAELAWTNLDQTIRAFSLGRNIFTPFVPGWEKKKHPAQKPLSLMRWCLQFIDPLATVLDPFMGSGSTGVACMELGRKFIGIEASAEYFSIACERLSDMEQHVMLSRSG